MVDRAKVDYYASLPYTIVVERHNWDGMIFYSGRVLEFEEVMSDGSTYDAAYRNAKEILKDVIIGRLSVGKPIPRPGEY
jgi:predicted RNase H-like HicB family nuclease